MKTTCINESYLFLPKNQFKVCFVQKSFSSRWFFVPWISQASWAKCSLCTRALGPASRGAYSSKKSHRRKKCFCSTDFTLVILHKQTTFIYTSCFHFDLKTTLLHNYWRTSGYIRTVKYSRHDPLGVVHILISDFGGTKWSRGVQRGWQGGGGTLLCFAVSLAKNWKGLSETY